MQGILVSEKNNRADFILYMLTELVKYLSVFLFSMFKFILGPATGVLAGVNYASTVTLTVGGMMTSVILFTFFGERVKKYYFNKITKKDTPTFTRKKRTLVRVWRKYGMPGVALLTPILLTPIGGTVLAVSFGENRWKIFVYMLISAIFWSLSLSFVVFYVKDLT